MSLEQYARLTDASEAIVYRHPRDKENQLIPPAEAAPAGDAPASLDEELAAAAAVMAAYGVSEEERQKGLEIVQRSHSDADAGESGGPGAGGAGDQRGDRLAAGDP